MSKSLRSFATLFVIVYGLTLAVSLQRKKPEVVFNTPPEAQTQTNRTRQYDAEPLPSGVLIEVPFTSQAPFADWGDPYQEACEEASLIMVHAFLEGESLTQEEADLRIRTLTNWEKEHGYPEDISLEDVAKVARTYYGYDSIIHENPSVEDMQSLLSQGTPVIVPAAGRELGNPYFSGEGPWYHMLVLRGYDKHSFITNDPGTRRGEGYKYRYDTLIGAIHDWTGIKEDITSGSPKVLIIKKNR